MREKIPLFVKCTMVLTMTFFLYSNKLFAQDPSLCLECHEDMAATLQNSPHELTAESAEFSALSVNCFGCHDGWQVHAEDPSTENISRPDNLSQSEQSEVCSRCHLTPHQSAMATTDPHMNAGLACTSCHMIHDNGNAHLVKEDLDNFCVTCHSSIAAEFQMKSSHPLESGNIRCVDCHDMAMIENREFKIGFDWKCQSCHEDQAGPYLYEHPVVYDYLVEGGGCTECHAPHGSVNDRLLKESGRVICLQCHSLPPGHIARHAGLGSKFECVQCHSEVHGSYSNNLFLDPDLGNKLFPDCYQSGCHTVGN